MPKNTDLGADADRVRREEQGRVDSADQLTEGELSEKESLLRQVGVDVSQSLRAAWPALVISWLGVIFGCYSICGFPLCVPAMTLV